MRQRSCSCHLTLPKGKQNRIITVCRSLGSHLTEGEISALIENQNPNTAATRQTAHFNGSKEDRPENKSRDSGDMGSARTHVTFDGSVPLLDTDHPMETSENQPVKTGNITSSNPDNFSTDSLSSLSERTNSSASTKSFATNCKSRPDCVEVVEPKFNPTTRSLQQRGSKRKNVLQYTACGLTASPTQTKFGSDKLLSLWQPQEQEGMRLNIENYREQLDEVLKQMNRGDLLPTLNRSQRLFRDLVEDYYTRKKRADEEPAEKRILRSSTRQQQLPSTSPRRQSSRLKVAKQQPVTCEVKMRVRIQYKSHRHLLTGIESVKNTPEERQMDTFFQATSIMRGRDTGCVVCNISFSDITYLGAFWRDYTNGALQEALRGVFLTEMMRQTAGDEELDLLVSVDEKDYIEGQKLLVKNLETGNVESPTVTGLNLRGQIGVTTTARIENI